MGKQFESHPDAQSRRKMLELMHRRAGQQLQLTDKRNKTPQHAEQEASPAAPAQKDSIH